MKTKFLMSDTTVSVVKLSDDFILDDLPAQIYTVCYSQMAGFYLSITKDQLVIPAKIYGTTPARVQKCLQSYVDRPASTGILLTGHKGTGKTLLMSVLANEVVKQLKIPVILIKEAYAGAEFVAFIELIGECALVFDEFGKMYSSLTNRHGPQPEGDIPQKALLSLMDGVDKTKRMIIMTENSEGDISEFMLNRPSRVYYHFRYKKLEEQSIIGYCEDYDIDGLIIREIIELSRKSRIFSFDMLQSIIEEHIRFGSSIAEVTADLNIDISEDSNDQMEILKVISKNNEEEMEIFEGANIVSRPERHGHTYIKLKMPEVAPYDEDGDEVCEEETDGRKYFEFHIRESDMSYEKGDQRVYDSDQYTVFVKNMPKKFNSVYLDYMG